VQEGFLRAFHDSTSGSRLFVTRWMGSGPVMGRSSAETVSSHHEKRKETELT
jgi:hypothetical protein